MLEPNGRKMGLNHWRAISNASLRNVLLLPGPGQNGRKGRPCVLMKGSIDSITMKRRGTCLIAFYFGNPSYLVGRVPLVLLEYGESLNDKEECNVSGCCCLSVLLFVFNWPVQLTVPRKPKTGYHRIRW